MQVKIKKAYLDLVPRASKSDYKSLKNSLENDGQYLPITINQHGIILDGHTRYKALKELGIKPKFQIKKFEDPYEEERFVVIANLSRRHLNLFQKGEVLFQWWKQEADKRYHTAGNNTWKTRRGIPYKKKERLHYRVAKMLGCAHTTAWHIYWILTHCDQKTIRMCRKGTMLIGTAFSLNFKNGATIGATDKYRDDYDGIRYPTCLRCGARTLSPKKTKCHVHVQQCCPKCQWGF